MHLNFAAIVVAGFAVFVGSVTREDVPWKLAAIHAGRLPRWRHF